MAKTILFSAEARRSMQNGVDILADTVKSYTWTKKVEMLF